MLLGLLVYGIGKLSRLAKGETIIAHFSANRFVVLAFILGYWMHLLGDLPTPASVWGGIELFWPSSVYVGGSGKIWWWNNYDIFLIVLLCVMVNGLLLLLAHLFKRNLRLPVLAVFLIAFMLIVIQINTRRECYSYTGNTLRYNEMEQLSKEEQQRILGRRPYRTMDWVDRHRPWNF